MGETQALDPRLTAAFEKRNGFPLQGHLVLLARVGSHSHGTYLPPDEPNAIDDVDLMGFVVPPIEYHLGLPQWEGWNWQFEELDVCLYSLTKAVRLLLKGNPNIIGTLWLDRDLDPGAYPYHTPAALQLRAHRDLFNSQEVATAFAGYAYGQLKRMTAFDEARMAEYERLRTEIEKVGPIAELVEGSAEQTTRLAKQWKLSAEMVQRFRTLHKQHFSGYMGEKRKAMVRKYQYDVKNAAHLIRLLRMGREFLSTGHLQVFRTSDADELRAIKRGQWPLAQVQQEAERLFNGFDAAVSASSLPPAPDHRGANDLLMEIHRQILRLPAPLMEAA